MIAPFRGRGSRQRNVTSRRDVKRRVVPRCAEPRRAERSSRTSRTTTRGRRNEASPGPGDDDHHDEDGGNDDDRGQAPARPGSGGRRIESALPPAETAPVRFPPHYSGSPSCSHPVVFYTRNAATTTTTTMKNDRERSKRRRRLRASPIPSLLSLFPPPPPPSRTTSSGQRERIVATPSSSSSPSSPSSVVHSAYIDLLKPVTPGHPGAAESRVVGAAWSDDGGFARFPFAPFYALGGEGARLPLFFLLPLPPPPKPGGYISVRVWRGANETTRSTLEVLAALPVTSAFFPPPPPPPVPLLPPSLPPLSPLPARLFHVGRKKSAV